MERKGIVLLPMGVGRDLDQARGKNNLLYDARNIRISPSEHNSMFAITTERGDKMLHRLEGRCIGVCDTKNGAFIFTTTTTKGEPNDDTISNLYWYNGFEPTLIFSTNLLGLTGSHLIEAKFVQESTNVCKLYWVDGYHQPRMLVFRNGINPVDITHPTQLDFSPDLQLNEEVDIVKTYDSTGRFPSGTVQYFITYFNKYGQETNVAYSSPIHYASPEPSRGGAPNEICRNAFTITVKNVDTKFEYMRIYSHISTSEANGVVNRVADIKIDNNDTITYKDTNVDVESEDPSRLILLQNNSIIPDAIEIKDGAMFLGNFKKKYSIKDVKKIIFEAAKDKVNNTTTIDSSYEKVDNQLDRNHFDNFYFRTGGVYTLGFIPIFNNGERGPVIRFRRVRVEDKDRILKPLARIDIRLSIDVSNKLIKSGVKALIPVVRDTPSGFVCQGVISPTIYQVEDRADNSPYAQSSPFYRPFTAHEVKDRAPKLYHAEYRHSCMLPSYEKDNAEMFCQPNDLYDDNPTYIPSGAIKSFGKMYMIDSSVMTIDTPELTRGDSTNIAGTNITMNELIIINKSYSGYDIKLEGTSVTRDGGISGTGVIPDVSMIVNPLFSPLNMPVYKDYLYKGDNEVIIPIQPYSHEGSLMNNKDYAVLARNKRWIYRESDDSVILSRPVRFNINKIERSFSVNEENIQIDVYNNPNKPSKKTYRSFSNKLVSPYRMDRQDNKKYKSEVIPVIQDNENPYFYNLAYIPVASSTRILREKYEDLYKKVEEYKASKKEPIIADYDGVQNFMPASSTMPKYILERNQDFIKPIKRPTHIEYRSGDHLVVTSGINEEESRFGSKKSFVVAIPSLIYNPAVDHSNEAMAKSELLDAIKNVRIPTELYKGLMLAIMETVADNASEDILNANEENLNKLSARLKELDVIAKQYGISISESMPYRTYDKSQIEDEYNRLDPNTPRDDRQKEKVLDRKTKLGAILKIAKFNKPSKLTEEQAQNYLDKSTEILDKNIDVIYSVFLDESKSSPSFRNLEVRDFKNRLRENIEKHLNGAIDRHFLDYTGDSTLDKVNEGLKNWGRFFTGDEDEYAVESVREINKYIHALNKFTLTEYLAGDDDVVIQATKKFLGYEEDFGKVDLNRKDSVYIPNQVLKCVGGDGNIDWGEFFSGVTLLNGAGIAGVAAIGIGGLAVAAISGVIAGGATAGAIAGAVGLAATGIGVGLIAVAFLVMGLISLFSSKKVYMHTNGVVGLYSYAKTQYKRILELEYVNASNTVGLSKVRPFYYDKSMYISASTETSNKEVLGKAMLWKADVWDSNIKVDDNSIDRDYGYRYYVSGPMVKLSNTGTKIEFKAGDVLYQKYQHIKTMPREEKSKNQVIDAVGFWCITKTNIDGRYDRNKGTTDVRNASNKNFNLMNLSYSRLDTFFGYRDIDIDKYDEDFPSSVFWTPPALPLDKTDIRTLVNLYSIYNLPGNNGYISKIVDYMGRLIAVQEIGVSELMYNSRVQIEGSDGAPIELSNNRTLAQHRSLNDFIGTGNKFAVKETLTGLLIFDTNTLGLFSLSNELSNVSTKMSMKAYFRTLPVAKLDALYESVQICEDLARGHIYIVTENEALCLNPTIGSFESFFDYGSTQGLFSINSSSYRVYNDSIYRLNTGEYGMFGDKKIEYYMDYQVNPDGFNHKIFTNGALRGDAINLSGERIKDVEVSKCEVYNEYQSSSIPLKYNRYMPSSLKKKFRGWHFDFPRENNIIKNRMLNHWVNVKIWLSPTMLNKIHDLVVTYYE